VEGLQLTGAGHGLPGLDRVSQRGCRRRAGRLVRQPQPVRPHRGRRGDHRSLARLITGSMAQHMRDDASRWLDMELPAQGGRTPQGRRRPQPTRGPAAAPGQLRCDAFATQFTSRTSCGCCSGCELATLIARRRAATCSASCARSRHRLSADPPRRPASGARPSGRLCRPGSPSVLMRRCGVGGFAGGGPAGVVGAGPAIRVGGTRGVRRCPSRCPSRCGG